MNKYILAVLLATGWIQARAQNQIFQDVPPSAPYFAQVNQMYAMGLTSGCSGSPLLFCPTASVTRGQVAVFFVRAIFSSQTGNPENFTYGLTPYFSDVPSTHPFFKYVQKMKELGITSGTSATTYSPDNPVDHGQLAVFTVRARQILSAGGLSAPACPGYGSCAAAELFPNELFSPWASEYGFFHDYIQSAALMMGWSANQEIAYDCQSVYGSGYFCTGISATRAQVAFNIIDGVLARVPLLRSWSTFYPMFREQQRGQRAANPWNNSNFLPKRNGSLGAQLTWRIPQLAPSSLNPPSNRPNTAFPEMAAAWFPYYAQHPPEYYLNWWCNEPVAGSVSFETQVYDPNQRNTCTSIRNYWELITEIPSVNGTAALLLGLWATANNAKDPTDPTKLLQFYSAYYDPGVCDQLDAGTFAGFSTVPSRPLLFGLPVVAPLVQGEPGTASTFVGPAVCSVSFTDPEIRDVNHIYQRSWSKSYIATTVFEDFQASYGHQVKAVNYYYSGPYPNRQCSNLPAFSPVQAFDNSQVPNACVVALEAYRMVDTSSLPLGLLDHRLLNGMIAWGGIDSTGNFNDNNWDYDYGWWINNAFQTPTVNQFYLDGCNGDLQSLTCF